MKLIQNAMRLQALRATADNLISRMAEVTGYDPTNYAVKLKIHPEEIQTGFLPLASIWVGNSWGMFTAPNIGDMCVVEFVDGDIESGYIESRFFNDLNRPLPVPAGEFWLVHVSGAFFKLTNDGKGAFSDGHGATITLNGDGTITSAATQWHHTGPLNVSGNLTAADVITNVLTSLNTHVHGGVQSGGSNTGGPSG